MRCKLGRSGVKFIVRTALWNASVSVVLLVFALKKQRSSTYRIQSCAIAAAWLRERTACLGSSRIKGNSPHQYRMRFYSKYILSCFHGTKLLV